MKKQMLTDFLLGQDIGFALLQELANNDLSNIYGYSAHINEATQKKKSYSNPYEGRDFC